MTKLSPELRDVIDEIQRQGWRVVQTRNTHYKCFSPDRKTIAVIAVSGDARAIKNIIARLRRAGAKIHAE